MVFFSRSKFDLIGCQAPYSTKLSPAHVLCLPKSDLELFWIFFCGTALLICVLPFIFWLCSKRHCRYSCFSHFSCLFVRSVSQYLLSSCLICLVVISEREGMKFCSSLAAVAVGFLVAGVRAQTGTLVDLGDLLSEQKNLSTFYGLIQVRCVVAVRPIECAGLRKI